MYSEKKERRWTVMRRLTKRKKQKQGPWSTVEECDDEADKVAKAMTSCVEECKELADQQENATTKWPFGT